MRLKRRTLLVVFVFCFVLKGALAQGDTPQPRGFLQTAISPDGTRVAWVEETVNSAGEPTGSAIFVQDLNARDSKPRRISAAGDAVSASEDTIAWAPDSKHLAFLSDAAGGQQAQFYAADLEGEACINSPILRAHLPLPAGHQMENPWLFSSPRTLPEPTR